MIEQLDDFHLPMFLQLLVSCIRLWHHTVVHRLRLTGGPLAAHLSGVHSVNIGSRAGRARKTHTKAEDDQLQASRAGDLLWTPEEIQGHLYLFDLIDALALVGLCNKEKMVRSLSLVLVQEAGKLKRLVAGQDRRKSLADILHSSELVIRERIAERMLLVKMFKHKAATGEPSEAQETMTETFGRAEVEQVIMNLSFFKIIEDAFDYRAAKINESFARDLAVQHVGELATMWKNEFKGLVQNKRLHTKDSATGRLRRQHRIIGQKILNFVFNVSRRALVVFEGKVDAFR